MVGFVSRLLSKKPTYLYAVKVTAGQEKNVAMMISDKVKVKNLPIVAILAPSSLKGYIIVESSAPHIVDEVIMGMRHAKGRVPGLIAPKEVDHYLKARSAVEGLEVGVWVEVIAGPFKGMKAIVVRVDISKEEVTIELKEAKFSMPITVHAEYVRKTSIEGS